MRIVHRQPSPSGSRFAPGMLSAAVGTVVPARTFPDVGPLGQMKLLAADIAPDGSYADLTWEADMETAHRLLGDPSGSWSVAPTRLADVETYEIGPGVPIDRGISDMLGRARETGRMVRSEFNSIEIVVSPDDSAKDVVDRWDADRAAHRYAVEVHKALQVEVAARVALAKVLNELGAKSAQVPQADLAREVLASLAALGLAVRSR